MTSRRILSQLRRRSFAATSATALLAVVVLALAARGSGATSTTASILFEEASATLGVVDSNVDTWGVAVADWDRDGCDDLYVGRHLKKFPRLFRNGCPGTFSDETARLGLTAKSDWHTPAFGHLDPDDRPDLFISTGGGGADGPLQHPTASHDQLFHALSGGGFENVAPALGIVDQDGSGRFAIWFDYDRDDDLDLFVGHQAWEPKPEASKNLLWGNENGALTNVAPAAGIAEYESSTSGLATDLDLDGDLDLVTVPGQRVSVYQNSGDGTFSRTSLGVPGLTKMVSVAAADYDNDGDSDLFLTRAKDSRLLRNDGLGAWIDVTGAAGARVFNGGSALWVDADSDGWQDLYVVRQAPGQGVPKHPNVLLVNQRDGTFLDGALEAGVQGPLDSTDKQRSSAAWGDFDRDGRPDLAVLTARWSANPVQVYLNRTTTNNWLTLHLHDPLSGNPDAIGAKIWITAGGMTQYRELTSGTADKSQSPPYFIVGLGESVIVEELRIEWPDGESMTFAALLANQHYVLDRLGGLTFGS